VKSLPTIPNSLIIHCFSKLRLLYQQDPVKLLNAAVKATAHDQNPFIANSSQIEPQFEVIQHKIKLTADAYGQQLLLKILEELYDDLLLNGALGVAPQVLLDTTRVEFEDKSWVEYKSTKNWSWSWTLDVDGNSRTVEMDVRNKLLSTIDIVPDYTLQFVQQSMVAFKYKRYAVALALISVALEGTLRDALASKGYTYQPSSPKQDVYELSDVEIHKAVDGYKVTFPNTMPLDHTSYLSNPDDPTSKTFRIKRLKKDSNKTVLEIRTDSDFLDYWSSNTISEAGTMQISGLGAAIHIGRKHAGIISPTDLPEDLDQPIQAVRNNLIHLSGTALDGIVLVDVNGKDVSLRSFLDNKNRVFDAVCSVGDAINKIYNRIANKTL
jgi:uncharacterized protein (DUF1778 family)